MSDLIEDIVRRIDELAGAAPSEAVVDELIELGEALHFAERTKGLEVATGATAMAEGLGYRSGEAWALLAQCHCLVFVGPFDASIELASRALDHFESENDDRGRARALTALSEAHHVAGDAFTALEFSSLAVALADRSKDRLAQGWAFNALGCDYRLMRDLERATLAHERALAAFEIAELDVGIAYARGNLGWDLLLLGEPERALELFTLTHEYEREHLPKTVGLGLAMIGRAELALGRHEHAVRHLRASVDALRASKETRYEVSALVGLSRGLTALHNTGDAKAIAEQAVALARAIDSIDLEIEALAAHGHALQAAGSTDEALRILRASAETAERASSTGREIEAWDDLAHALENAGHLPEALTALKRSLALRAPTQRRSSSTTRAHHLATSPRALTILQRYRDDQSILSLCSYCHAVAISDHTWGRIEVFLQTQLDVRCSHGICPDCFENVLADLDRPT